MPESNPLRSEWRAKKISVLFIQHLRLACIPFRPWYHTSLLAVGAWQADLAWLLA